MNKEEAARALAKELGSRLERAVVIEDSYKDSLLKNALAAYRVGNPVNVDFYDNKFFLTSLTVGKENVIDVLLGYKGFFAEANYCFLESIHARISKYSNGESRFVATPYALIGEKEASSLRGMFYKNVPPDIAHAMNVLKIDNFIGLYEKYFSRPDDSLFTVKKNDLDIAERFINLAGTLFYDKDNEVAISTFNSFGHINSFNAWLDGLGISAHIDPHGSTDSRYVSKDKVNSIFSQLSKLVHDTKHTPYGDVFQEFMEFVFFSLPDEDRNIGSDKRILKEFTDLSFVVDVLSKEYVKGRNFSTYFEVLDKDTQSKIVNILKGLPERKPLYDSFLWSRGFKDIALDHLRLYEKNPEGFIEYFKDKPVEEKKVMLKDVMEHDSVNEKVIDWLNENEPDLVREVGFNT